MNIVPSLVHPLTSTHHHVAAVGLELLQRCSTERLTDSTKTEATTPGHLQDSPHLRSL